MSTHFGTPVPDLVHWTAQPDGLGRASKFALTEPVLERLRGWLNAPERKAQITNVNRYWLARRLNLNFSLEPNGIVIYNDSNLASRITEQDRLRCAQLPPMPGFLVALLAQIVRYGSRILAQGHRFVGLQQLRMRVRRGQSFPLSAFPFGTWASHPEIVAKEPMASIRAAWPDRALLMLHAADVIHHFAPACDGPWNVLEIGSGPAMLAGLMMGAFSTRHVLIDLPEQIAVGFCFLSEFYPEKRILLPHEASEMGRADEAYDCIFLTPEQLPLLSNRRFQIAVNMFSFQEMSAKTIGSYFKLIRERLTDEGVFYCANQIAKRNPHDGGIAEFARYPWQVEDQFLFDQDMRSVPGARSCHREALVRMSGGTVLT